LGIKENQSIPVMQMDDACQTVIKASAVVEYN